MNQQLFSDFSLTGGILYTMWIFATAIAIIVLVLALLRLQKSTDVPAQGPQTHMEISTGIGIPPEELDASQAGQADRQAGVALPRIPPPTERAGGGSLASANLRKIDLPKEVELVWEAGGLIEFQPGAWAVAKDPSEHSQEHMSDESGQEPSHPTVEETYTLPQRYGIDRLVLMARDPNWIYAYWEVTHEKYRQKCEKHLRNWGLSRPVLRIYNLTLGQGRHKEMDIFISDNTDNWYINISRPRHTLMAELGRLFPEDVFVSLLASNIITLPADAVSDRICPEWPPMGRPEQYPQLSAKIGTSSPMTWRQDTDG